MVKFKGNVVNLSGELLPFRKMKNPTSEVLLPTLALEPYKYVMYFIILATVKINLV